MPECNLSSQTASENSFICGGGLGPGGELVLITLRSESELWKILTSAEEAADPLDSSESCRSPPPGSPGCKPDPAGDPVSRDAQPGLGAWAPCGDIEQGSTADCTGCTGGTRRSGQGLSPGGGGSAAPGTASVHVETVGGPVAEVEDGEVSSGGSRTWALVAKDVCHIPDPLLKCDMRCHLYVLHRSMTTGDALLPGQII